MGVSKFASDDKKKQSARRVYKFPSFWSFSRWNVKRKCDARYELQYLQKLPQPPSIHLERGIDVHEKGQYYLEDTIRRLPVAYKEFGSEMRAIKKLGATAEGNYAFTKSWNSCEPTDWNNAWLRVKIDAEVFHPRKRPAGHLATLTQIDFKTGRAYPDTADQSELYAVTGFLRHPKVNTIDTEFWYLDSGEVVNYIYSRDEYPELKKKWQARGQELLAARQFPPTKSAYICKYCPFRSDKKLGNGQPGPCEAWKKAK